MCAVCPAHLTLFYLITLTILDHEYKVWHSLCNFLHFIVASSFLHPKILLSVVVKYPQSVASFEAFTVVMFQLDLKPSFVFFL